MSGGPVDDAATRSGAGATRTDDAPPDLPAPHPVARRAGSRRPFPPWAQLRAWRPTATAAALVCALLAVLVGSVAASAARGPGGGVTTLVHVSARDGIAPLVRHDDPSFRFVSSAAHYDGTYYYAIARDPLALGRYHHHIDLAAKRYGHPFYGQVAWALSFGEAYRVPWALLIVSLAALGAAAFCISRIAALLGWPPWAGLVVPLSPGLLYATTADTAEVLGAALIAAALLAWLRGRRGWATAAFVAMSLTKEPFSLVPLGVLLFEAASAVRRDGRAVALRALRGRAWLAPTAACLLGPVLLVAWLQYVQHRFARPPLAGNADASTFPFSGLVDTLRRAGAYGHADFGRVQIGAVAVPLVLVLIVAVLCGLAAAVRLRTIVDAVFLVTAPLMVILTPANVLYPKDYLRLTVIPFLLLPGVLARRGTAPSVPTRPPVGTAGAAAPPRPRRAGPRRAR